MHSIRPVCLLLLTLPIMAVTASRIDSPQLVPQFSWEDRTQERTSLSNLCDGHQNNKVIEPRFPRTLPVFHPHEDYRFHSPSFPFACNCVAFFRNCHTLPRLFFELFATPLRHNGTRIMPIEKHK